MPSCWSCHMREFHEHARRGKRATCHVAPRWLAADASGAFAMVVEGATSGLAEEITRQVRIPTIGIGTSDRCDGPILVTDDMPGRFDWAPKIVRRYGELREAMPQAASRRVRARPVSGATPPRRDARQPGSRVAPASRRSRPCDHSAGP
ncbi:hypothetical protein G3N57_05225 [Paraburkholderia sp. Se-20369]|nr:hypothetical protein [Paraburkholderia sp. Se-20369]